MPLAIAIDATPCGPPPEAPGTGSASASVPAETAWARGPSLPPLGAPAAGFRACAGENSDPALLEVAGAGGPALTSTGTPTVLPLLPVESACASKAASAASRGLDSTRPEECPPTGPWPSRGVSWFGAPCTPLVSLTLADAIAGAGLGRTGSAGEMSVPPVRCQDPDVETAPPGPPLGLRGSLLGAATTLGGPLMSVDGTQACGVIREGRWIGNAARPIFAHEEKAKSDLNKHMVFITCWGRDGLAKTPAPSRSTPASSTATSTPQ